MIDKNDTRFKPCTPDMWVPYPSDHGWYYTDGHPNTRIEGSATIEPNAWVSGNARVEGNAQVYGNARVSVVCTATPKVITGLLYTLTITDEHLRAGCQVHTFPEWRNKTEREVLAMGGKAALVFFKETLIPLMDVLKLRV